VFALLKTRNQLIRIKWAITSNGSKENTLLTFFSSNLFSMKSYFYRQLFIVRKAHCIDRIDHHLF